VIWFLGVGAWCGCWPEDLVSRGFLGDFFFGACDLVWFGGGCVWVFVFGFGMLSRIILGGGQRGRLVSAAAFALFQGRVVFIEDREWSFFFFYCSGYVFLVCELAFGPCAFVHVALRGGVRCFFAGVGDLLCFSDGFWGCADGCAFGGMVVGEARQTLGLGCLRGWCFSVRGVCVIWHWCGLGG